MISLNDERCGLALVHWIVRYQHWIWNTSWVQGIQRVFLHILIDCLQVGCVLDQLQKFSHLCIFVCIRKNETIQNSFILVSFFLSILTAWNVYWQSKMAIVTYQLLGLRPMQITLVMLTVSIHLVSHILVSLGLVWPSWCTLIEVVRRTSQAL